MVALARAVGRAGGAAPAVYNASNEVAVDAFLSGAIPFPGIHQVVDEVASAHQPSTGTLTLAALLDQDAQARRQAAAVIQRRFG